MDVFLEYFFRYFFLFGDALKMTLYLATFGILIGLVLGLIFGIMKLSKKLPLRIVTGVYIGFVRGTPLLVQLFIMSFVVGRYVSWSAPALASIGLGIHNGAYIAEIVRGAIQSIDRGQMEAARSLGMTHAQAMRRVILPQALKRAVPAMGNQFIIAIKDSSLAFSITVMELMGRTRVFIGSTYQPFPILAIVSIYYLVLTYGLSLVVGMLERHLAKGEVRV